ncbi:MAG: beta-N-acetylglucosaminidase domain-containing protein [Tissierellia bacterium]|nr:beta-N-acetylglucosaminidase domain-containing protein [Tissierellia bacterium]
MKRLYTNKEKLFYPSYEGSKFYRIPLLFKTKDDTILAICDKRNDRIDDYGNIDLVLRRKEKGKDFDAPIEVINLQEEIEKDTAAFTIDASIVQSSKTGRIFLFTTLYPSCKGFYDIDQASGYIDIDGNKYLLLRDKNNNEFYLQGDKVYTIDQKETAYRVLLGDKQPFRYFGDIYQGEMLIGNIFLEKGPLRVMKTSFLAMTYSDDDGKTWYNLSLLNADVKTEDMKFIGVSPSRGLELKSGRLLIPAYFTNRYDKQSSCLIASDDDGISWSLKAISNDNRLVGEHKISYQEDFNEYFQLGESSILNLQDGRILALMRNYRHGYPLAFTYLISYDQAETFSHPTRELDVRGQSWCQCGSCHFQKDSKDYVLVSQASSYGDWSRKQGRISLFELKDKELVAINSIDVDFGGFAYSSLVQVDEEKFAIFYERGRDLNSLSCDLIYREFSMDEIFRDSKEKFKTEYEIYPKVKEIKYLNRTGELFEIEYDFKGDDLAIKEKLKDIEKKFSRKNPQGLKTKIKITIDPRLESKKIDYYELDLKEDIRIRARDEYSCYYALMSLEQILRQAKGNYRQLSIKDYASQEIRGVIEGYYGIPWGNLKRAEIIKFISKFKGNVFVFAPKDDPYHRDKWYEYYPEDELNEIRDLVDLSAKLKVRYVWTISPFKKDSNPIDNKNYPSMIEVLKRKFDQLYDIGVRQFGVLGDDVGKLPRDVVVKVMTELSKWAKTKEGVFDFLFVPESYVLADWGFDKDELDLYSKSFPADVQIIFTGETTCAPLNQRAIDLFKNKDISYGQRRDPVFWLNWPVNDVDRTEFRRLFMGKASMLERAVKNIKGTIINPMEEAIASFPAIFQIVDYAWNSNDFDSDRSWKASFEFIDKDLADDLYEISKHMSSADNGGIEGLEESEYIGILSKKLEDALEADDYRNLLYNTKLLSDEYQKIVKSIESFMVKTKNKLLLDEMRPYLNNLLYKSKAALSLIDLLRLVYEEEKGLLDSSDYGKIWSEIGENLQISKSFRVYTRTAEFPKAELRAESACKFINKNIDFMYKYIQNIRGY